MKELYLSKLSNGKEAFVVAEDIGYARDKVSEWIKERFIGGSAPTILDMKLVAESKNRGRAIKLIL